MALPTMETQAKVASEAAQVFIDHYYEALTRRRPLGPFYASTSPRLTSAGVKPDISINGRFVGTEVSAYEELLKTQGEPVSYDVGSFDVQPVNPWYRAGEPESTSSISAALAGNTTTNGAGGGAGATGRDATAVAATLRNGDRMSFAVQVSGTVRYGRGHVATGEGGPAKAVVDAATTTTIIAPAVGGTAAAAADGHELLEKDFNESFLLVPHWEAWGRNAPKGLRKWVIVSQNFRAL
ncbi:hypothetical protein F4677DRAFT_79954 [Hypoxylon crocopeplum]|nr:hypothetical protein F4677DRAFT_79954 [Hypoxylon crocopeplum]